MMIPLAICGVLGREGNKFSRPKLVLSKFQVLLFETLVQWSLVLKVGKNSSFLDLVGKIMHESMKAL